MISALTQDVDRLSAGVESPMSQTAGHGSWLERQPVILLTTTLHLDKTARLAMAFADIGCVVAVLCPPGHWVKSTRCAALCLPYGPLRPLRSLLNAIERIAPDIIIPCDDRAVRHMHTLHASTTNADVRARLSRSLNPPETFAMTEARHDLLVLARREGIAVPDTQQINSMSDLQAWHAKQPLPWVLKSDGSWAGMGVRIVRNWAEAVTAFELMSRPVKLSMVLNQAVLEWDFFWLAPWLRAERVAVSAQQYIPGNAANCALATWKGECLAGIAVEVVMTRSHNGPASVVRVTDNCELMDSARRLVHVLRMSGLVGFDFIIEAATGKAFLVEMNARSVPLCHLALGPGRDLIAALLTRMTGTHWEPRLQVTQQDLLIFFPGIWTDDPNSPLFGEGYHDVPWGEVAMLRRLLKADSKRPTFLLRCLRQVRQSLQQRSPLWQ